MICSLIQIPWDIGPDLQEEPPVYTGYEKISSVYLRIL